MNAQKTIILLFIMGTRTIVAGHNTEHNQSTIHKIMPSQLIGNWQYPRGGIPGMGRAFTKQPLIYPSLINSESQQTTDAQSDTQQEEARFAFDTYEIALIKKWKDIIKKNPTIADELLDFEKHLDKALSSIIFGMETGQEYNPNWFENSKRYRTKNIHLRDLIENYLTKHLGEKIVFSPTKFKNPLLFTEEMGSKHISFASQYLIDREKLERLKDIILAIKKPLRFNNNTTFQP